MSDKIGCQVEHSRLFRNAAIACFGALSLLLSSVVQAASLGKLEVASPLGKPLYAEVPLKLESNELASKVFIEIASLADYKIFEVYRDPVLDNIRADVASDERGVRVKLTSRIGISMPFFNLVLKVRYGRVSHFKKYAVFLDAGESIQRVVEKEPLPRIESVMPIVANENTGSPVSSKLIESAGKALVSEQDVLVAQGQLEAQQASPKVYEGWSRTEKYGPIVRGDSLSIVAQRLRVDKRYSIHQVMVALFEKNQQSFNHKNMNLIKAKSFLQVPTALEVEKHSKSEAYRMSVEHRQAWMHRPRYAVEVESQRTRYSNRVSIGGLADGKLDGGSAAPKPKTQDLLKPEQHQKAVAIKETNALEVAKNNIAPQIEQLIQAQTETSQLLAALQQKNKLLQKQLIANKDSVDVLNEKVDEGTAAASNARVAKLELLLTRLQAEVEKQAQKVPLVTGTSSWITWLLLSLLLVMLGVIAILMRKEPAHPAVEQGAVFEADGDQLDPLVSEAEADVNALEEAVEEEVEAIETDEKEVSHAKETGTFDAMAAFTDELSDTDTAELEPFDADAKQPLDSNVDYLAEADVYIRYGMGDEALQQLDMALRLNPAHLEAHIKKSQLLHDKQDKQGFAVAFSAASVALSDTVLDQYKSTVEAFAGDVEVRVDEPTAAMLDAVDTVPPVTMTIDDTEIDELDFDLGGLGVTTLDSGVNVDAVLNDKEPDQTELAESEELEELDWLNDPSFASDDVSSAESPSAGETIAIAPDMLSPENMIESGAVSTANTTQQLSSLSDGFADDAGDTERLGGLLSEFTEQDDLEDAILDLDATAATEVEDDFEAGATQHLDSLLNEFSDDDLSFSDTMNDFDASVIEQAKSSSEPEITASKSIGAGIDYGATQELDSLLAEFSDDDDDGVSFIEPADSSASEQKGSSDISLDHGATQELDSLLGEFSDADDVAGQDNSDDYGATQVLGHLLDEFSDDEDDKKKS